LAALESDFQRLVINAKTYNEKDSEIHANAEKIRKLVHTFMTQHNPAYNDPDYTAVPTPIPDNATEETKPKEGGRRTRRKESHNVEEENAIDEANTADADGSSKVGKGKRRLTLNGPRSTSAAEQHEDEQPEGPRSPGSNASGTGFEGKNFQEAQEILLDDLLDFTNDELVLFIIPHDSFVYTDPFQRRRDFWPFCKPAPA
jgi:hypothetical protein